MSIAPTDIQSTEEYKALQQLLFAESDSNSQKQDTIQNQARIIHTLQEIIRAYQEQNQRLLTALGTHDKTETMQEFYTWSNAHEAMRRCDAQIETIREYTQDDLGI